MQHNSLLQIFALWGVTLTRNPLPHIHNNNEINLLRTNIWNKYSTCLCYPKYFDRTNKQTNTLAKYHWTPARVYFPYCTSYSRQFSAVCARRMSTFKYQVIHFNLLDRALGSPSFVNTPSFTTVSILTHCPRLTPFSAFTTLHWTNNQKNQRA